MNRYKSRNFDNHHVGFSAHMATVAESNIKLLEQDVVASNRLYDMNVGKTHMFVTMPDGQKRLVLDVEMAYSNDPSVSSMLPREFRAALQNGLVSQPRIKSNNLSDEQLLSGLRQTFGRETFESVAIAKDVIDSMPFPSPAPSDSPQELPLNNDDVSPSKTDQL